MTKIASRQCINSIHPFPLPPAPSFLQAFVSWAAAVDDGGGALTKYVVIASTAYADIDVEAITSVKVSDDEPGGEPPTEATVTGLTNGLVYSFRVVAANAFGYSAQSLPSNKVSGLHGV